MSTADEREKRRAARATWQGWKGKLEDMPSEPDSSVHTSLEERLALLRELSVRCWALTGQPVPDYGRAALPTRIIRGGAR